MRILPKNEANVLKQNERKIEIEQGLRLAKRVDELRKMNTDEESKMSKFREETVKIVQKEIDGLIERRDKLSFEVGVLEKQLDNLQKPFMEEWESLRDKKLSELDERSQKLEEKEKDMELKYENVLSKIREHEKKEAQISSDRLMTDDLMKNAEESKKEADSLLAQVNIHKAQVSSELDAKANQLLKRETELASNERDMALREEALRQSARELAKREQFINDKYRTLMKTEEYLKSKK